MKLFVVMKTGDWAILPRFAHKTREAAEQERDEDLIDEDETPECDIHEIELVE